MPLKSVNQNSPVERSFGQKIKDSFSHLPQKLVALAQKVQHFVHHIISRKTTPLAHSQRIIEELSTSSRDTKAKDVASQKESPPASKDLSNREKLEPLGGLPKDDFEALLNGSQTKEIPEPSASEPDIVSLEDLIAQDKEADLDTLMTEELENKTEGSQKKARFGVDEEEPVVKEVFEFEVKGATGCHSNASRKKVSTLVRRKMEIDILMENIDKEDAIISKGGDPSRISQCKKRRDESKIKKMQLLDEFKISFSSLSPQQKNWYNTLRVHQLEKSKSELENKLRIADIEYTSRQENEDAEEDLISKQRSLKPRLARVERELESLKTESYKTSDEELWGKAVAEFEFTLPRPIPKDLLNVANDMKGLIKLMNEAYKARLLKLLNEQKEGEDNRKIKRTKNQPIRQFRAIDEALSDNDLDKQEKIDELKILFKTIQQRLPEDELPNYPAIQEAVGKIQSQFDALTA